MSLEDANEEKSSKLSKSRFDDLSRFLWKPIARLVFDARQSSMAVRLIEIFPISLNPEI